MGFAILRITEISTHSLTRRLTGRDKSKQKTDAISTHSLTRRLTVEPEHHMRLSRYFNSQPHKEAD